MSTWIGNHFQYITTKPKTNVIFPRPPRVCPIMPSKLFKVGHDLANLNILSFLILKISKFIEKK